MNYLAVLSGYARSTRPFTDFIHSYRFSMAPDKSYFCLSEGHRNCRNFSETSVIYFCRGFSCCRYYQGVRNSGNFSQTSVLYFCRGFAAVGIIRVSSIARVRNSGNFSQTSVIYFCRGFSCCPYYQGVRNSEVSARRELTEQHQAHLFIYFILFIYLFFNRAGLSLNTEHFRPL